MVQFQPIVDRLHSGFDGHKLWTSVVVYPVAFWIQLFFSTDVGRIAKFLDIHSNYNGWATLDEVECNRCWQSINVTSFRYHVYLILYAFANSVPHPCSYIARCGDRTSLMPKIWHSRSACSVLPVDVGTPVSFIGLTYLYEELTSPVF